MSRVTFTIQGMDTLQTHFRNLQDEMSLMRGLNVDIGSPVPYAEAVYLGTRAHDISPSAMQALYWPGASHPSRRVHHPGARANPWLSEAFWARRQAHLTGIAEGISLAIQASPLAITKPFQDAVDRTLQFIQEQAPASIYNTPTHRAGTLRDSFHTTWYQR